MKVASSSCVYRSRSCGGCSRGRYFSDILTGSDVASDEEGTEFPDAAAAEHDARLAVLELAKDRLSKGPGRGLC